MYFLLIFFTQLALAQSPDLRNLTETSFTRDNTYCRLKNKRVEIQVRSQSALTEAKERNYGEFILYYPEEDKPEVLSIGEDKMHSYRLFKGQNSACSKSLGYLVGKDQLAVLFLKENSPKHDKLIIQYFDVNTTRPVKLLETDYPVDKTEMIAEGFAFRVTGDRQDLEMGKVTISSHAFTYQDRDFDVWMTHTPSGPEYSGTLSYQKSPWKNFFKNENDFLIATGWDAKEKKFSNVHLYLAVNHKLKNQCIYLAKEKTKFKDNEPGWRCR